MYLILNKAGMKNSKERSIFWKKILSNLDIHLEQNRILTLSPTIHKNQFQEDRSSKQDRIIKYLI